MDPLHTAAIERIDAEREELIALSLALHADPEIAYQERRASIRLADFLEKRGFAMERPFGGLETAYRGVVRGKSSGPTIAILAEYDALPDIGHACGHNLIAMIGTAAAIGAQAALARAPGSIEAIGTPAEEGGGGKVALATAGAFKKVDAAMMVHPSSRTLASRTSLASNRVELEFFGQAAHAAAQPDRGINALDGLIQTFNAINAMRQQLRPDARVHGIITSGGSAANIIPEYAAGRFSVRARDREYQQEVLRRFVACAEGAAAATGTRVKVTFNEHAGYENMVPSTPMAERWAKHLGALGVEVARNVEDERMGSTDMGNISQLVPAVHPYIAIAPEGTPGHSTAFRDAAATPHAQANALAAAKALALLAIDLLTEPALLAAAKAEFEQRRAAGVVKGILLSSISRDTRLLAGAQLLWGIGFGLIAPVVALFLDSLGATGTEIGLVIGVGTIVGALGVLPAGYLADRYGRKKLLIASAASGMLGAAAFIPLTDWRGAFVGSSLYWAAIAGLPIMTAHLAATVPRERLGTSMGIVYASFFFGIILAAPLSGFIASAYGLRAPFAGAVVLFGGSLVCDALISRGPERALLRSGPLPSRFWALLVLAPLAGLLAYLPTPLFPVYLRDLARVPLETTGILVGAVSLGSAAFSAAAGRLSDRIGVVPALMGAAVIVVVGSVALVLGTSSLPMLLAGSLFIGANQAANPVVAAAIERVLPPARLSVGYAAFQLAYTGGAGAGSIVAGLLHDTDPLLPYLVSAALALPIAAVVTLIVTSAMSRAKPLT